MGVVPQVVEWGRGYGGSCEGWNKVITTPKCDKGNVNMKKALSSSATCYLEQVDELVCWYKQGLDGLCFMMYFVSLSGKASGGSRRGEGAIASSEQKNKKRDFYKKSQNMSKNSRHETDFYNTHKLCLLTKLQNCLVQVAKVVLYLYKL